MNNMGAWAPLAKCELITRYYVPATWRNKLSRGIRFPFIRKIGQRLFGCDQEFEKWLQNQK